jgi:hypothetical protein
MMSLSNVIPDFAFPPTYSIIVPGTNNNWKFYEAKW